MKNTFIYILAICLFTVACRPAAPTFRIDGTWEGGDGRTVYLHKDLGDKSYDVLDSARVHDGKFSFSGPLVYDHRTIVAGGANARIMLEPSPVRVTIENVTRGDGEKARIVTLISVDSSPEQDVLKRGDEISLGMTVIDFGSMIAYADVIDDPVKFDSLRTGVEAMKAEMWGQLRTLLDSSRNTRASAFVIGKVVAKSQSLDSMIHYYDRLTPAVKESYSGLWLANEIEQMKSVNVGGIAPEIDLYTPDGSKISLHSLRGKYVLVDFWASWCGPCLAEAPNVKAVYDKYRDRGFEVYGVSLDEKTDAWRDAIAKNSLDWTHVSSLDGWKCPAARRYGVTGIPKTFLLDPDGKIIAVDLRGERLGETIASFLGN